MRQELIAARHLRGWSQTELGQRAGLPQMHISGIENGKVAPRFDTLLDLVRVLEQDVLLVPRELVPAVQALVRDHRSRAALGLGEEEERALYTTDEDGEEDRQR